MQRATTCAQTHLTFYRSSPIIRLCIILLASVTATQASAQSGVDVSRAMMSLPQIPQLPQLPQDGAYLTRMAGQSDQSDPGPKTHTMSQAVITTAHYLPVRAALRAHPAARQDCVSEPAQICSFAPLRPIPVSQTTPDAAIPTQSSHVQIEKTRTSVILGLAFAAGALFTGVGIQLRRRWEHKFMPCPKCKKVGGIRRTSRARGDDAATIIFTACDRCQYTTATSLQTTRIKVPPAPLTEPEG